MLTSMGRKGDVSRLQSIGFSAYLSKPFRQGQLHGCLSLALGRQTKNALENNDPLITRHTISETIKRKTRILVVDDNPTNQAVARVLLRKFGFASEFANNGEEAILAIQGSVFDLVFMDCQMPIMDGYEATRLIRSGAAGEKNKTLPVIAMTAQAMKGDRQQCLDAGMDDYLAKPVKPTLLNDILDKWLSQIKNKFHV